METRAWLVTKKKEAQKQLQFLASLFGLMLAQLPELATGTEVKTQRVGGVGSALSRAGRPQEGSEAAAEAGTRWSV